MTEVQVEFHWILWIFLKTRITQSLVSTVLENGIICFHS